MRWSGLFPHFAGLHVERVLVATEAIRVDARRAAATARCPSCGRRSRRVHSRYGRQIADEPLGGRPVEIRLHVRRFRCGARRCTRRTFAEQAPRLAGRRARRTVPLQRFLQDVALTIGGRPGARFAARRPIAVSRMTLIRLVRSLTDPPTPCPTVLGVDDFALRRGHRYGTVLVDVAASDIVDLLPERTAAALTAWLTDRGPPTLICRDRGGEYASGAQQGAPDAVQIADRFHLQRNSSQVLERVLQRHPAALRACVLDPAVDAAARAPAVESLASGACGRAARDRTPDNPEAPRRARRRARYEAVVAVAAQGLSLAAIAARVGLSRPTVRTYVRAGAFPEWPARRTRLGPGTAHGEFLRTRWQAGVRDAQALWDELHARGYRGSVRSVQRAVAVWRVGPTLRGRHTRRLARPPTAATWAHRPPSAAQAVWLLLRRRVGLTPDEAQQRQRLLNAAPEVQQALQALTAFRWLIHDRAAPALEPWLRAAEANAVPEVRAFAASLRRDQAAVQAALEYHWSSGRVEGHVTKIKLVKRQMYGRGNVDLLKRRVMHVD